MAAAHAASAGELQAGAGDPVRPLRLRRPERAPGGRAGSAARRHRRRLRTGQQRIGRLAMTDLPAQTSPEVGVQAEDEAYYHESGLNATWTGSRLAIGGLSFLFGAFVFTYFYLRSINSSGRWEGSGYVHPSLWMGTTIMLLAVLSASVHYFVLQRIKAGHKDTWQIGALVAMA